MHILQRLQAHGLITELVGTVPPEPRMAMLLWARSVPKEAFRGLVELARAIAQQAPLVVIDDLCAMAVTGRKPAAQSILNEQYREFFTPMECDVRFSSNFLENCALDDVRLLASRVQLRDVARAVPRAARTPDGFLSAAAVTHAFLELLCLDYLSMHADTLVIGPFGQGIVKLHRNLTDHPLALIIAPRLSGTTASYIESLRTVQERGPALPPATRAAQQVLDDYL